MLRPSLAAPFVLPGARACADPRAGAARGPGASARPGEREAQGNMFVRGAAHAFFCLVAVGFLSWISRTP